MSIFNLNLKKLLPFIVVAVFLILFFSYRLEETPNGINEDEASYGYNGILLAENLHDAHGRLLPIFILGSDEKTWYPPYMQYLVTLSFKLLNPSVFTMRLPTVFITIFTALLMYYLAGLLFPKKYAIVTLFSFITIPKVMIETHTPLEHMIVLPFLLTCLIALYKYREKRKNTFIILAALTLGAGFYSYAGIRPLTAIWIIITLLYIAYLNWPISAKENVKPSPSGEYFTHLGGVIISKKFLTPLIIFILATLPFFAVIPILERYYAGAVLNNGKLASDSIYKFFYFYLASFDPSFLFVTGDKLLIQSTLKHGMFLLSTLPLFALGLYRIYRKRDDYFTLLGITYFASPLLLGFIGTTYIGHRLLYMVPFYCIFITLGIKTLFEDQNRIWKYLGVFLIVLAAVNYFDFWHYYMFDYPKDTYHIFHHPEDYEKPYKILFEESQKRNLKPYISISMAHLDGMNITDVEKFTRALYFPALPELFDEEKDTLPENAILLSDKDNTIGLTKLDSQTSPPYLYIKSK